MTARSVLLVDDDDTTNYLHQLIIGKAGAEVELAVALDGRAALENLQARIDGGRAMPEVILLDINMPRMNGFEFLDAFGALPEEQRAGVRTVMVTTSFLPEDISRALANDFVSGFKTKPLSVADMQEILES